MMHAWHIGCGNGLRAPRIPRPQLLTLPLLAFMGEKWDCVSSPGGLKKTLQVASEVTYMEHMCLSTLWSRLPLPQRKAGNGQLDVREKKMVDNDEVWV